MENLIQTFSNSVFGEIRIVVENGNPLFAATDIARVLGYGNPRQAIASHCKGVLKLDGVSKTENQYGTITEQRVEMSYIPESDVYRLIMRSKLPQAEQFQDWVCEEVIPSIRKHGAYATDHVIEKVMNDPDFGIQLLKTLKDERQLRQLAESKASLLEEVTREQAPKVLFADAVATSQRSCLVSELAKILNQNGIEIGQNRLFNWLRSNGYLCKSGDYYNQPTQRSMDMKLFELKKTSIVKPDGTTLITTTTKVTGAGQIYFVNKFINSKKAS